MFQASFYPMAVKLYTDNVRASLTNSMSIKVRASFQAIEVNRTPFSLAATMTLAEGSKSFTTIFRLHFTPLAG